MKFDVNKWERGRNERGKPEHWIVLYLSLLTYKYVKWRISIQMRTLCILISIPFSQWMWYYAATKVVCCIVVLVFLVIVLFSLRPYKAPMHMQIQIESGESKKSKPKNYDSIRTVYQGGSFVCAHMQTLLCSMQCIWKTYNWFLPHGLCNRRIIKYITTFRLDYLYNKLITQIYIENHSIIDVGMTRFMIEYPVSDINPLLHRTPFQSIHSCSYLNNTYGYMLMCNNAISLFLFLSFDPLCHICIYMRFQQPLHDLQLFETIFQIYMAQIRRSCIVENLIAHCRRQIHIFCVSEPLKNSLDSSEHRHFHLKRLLFVHFFFSS